MGHAVRRLLLDTHALLWWWSGDPSLPVAAREAISDSDSTVFVSAASAWEIATKMRLGRLAAHKIVVSRFHELVAADAFEHLPVNYRHGLHAGRYPIDHSDPFDRMLAAQAELESLILVTRDVAFGSFPVSVLW